MSGNGEQREIDMDDFDAMSEYFDSMEDSAPYDSQGFASNEDGEPIWG